MTRLIIAEKHDMAKKIAVALKGPQKNGQGCIVTGDGTVTWCIGHIMQSFEPKDYDSKYEKWDINMLPILPEEWKVKVDSKKSGQFKTIKELLKTATEIVNAGDPGREGQLIVDEVLYYLNNRKPVKRLLLHSLEKNYIQEAFKKLRDNKEFYNLYQAAVLRGYSDFVMGINATRAYTIKAQKAGYKGILSVGRVQSPTLAIVVKRDNEIDNFISHAYYIINAKVLHKETASFVINWLTKKTPTNFLDSEGRLINEDYANKIVCKINKKSGFVTAVEEEEQTEQQPLPFNLSKLQIYANKKWGLSAKETLDTCQALYEKHEVQTYPRTDCQYLPENQHKDSEIILNNIKQSLPELFHACLKADKTIKSHAWNDKKLSDHFGLIPTQKKADIGALNLNEKRIYTSVCQRFIAQFYLPHKYLQTQVFIEIEDEPFKCTGRKPIVVGWKSVYQEDNEKTKEKVLDKEETEDSTQEFPKLQEGDKVTCLNAIKTNKKTTPPARFTEGSLIEAMTNVHLLVNDPEQKKKLKEKKGIGQEATRTHIIETLFERKFLVRKGKQIFSTEIAQKLIKLLPEKILDPGLTAIWEDALDKIAEGKLDPRLFKEKQNIWVTQLMEDVKKTTMTGFLVEKAETNNNTKCPKCDNGIMKERKSKDGNLFFGCSNFPACKHTQKHI